MTKRSRKRHVRYENSSCMWGIISILDFRQANRSNQKLIPDKRRGSRRTVDELGSVIELPINANDEGSTSSKSVHDGSKLSVKALIEEEMINEGDNLGHEDQKKYRKRSRRYSKESFDLNSNEDLAAVENHDIMEEFRYRIYQSSGTNQTSKSIVVLKPISNNLNSLSETSQAQVEKESSSFFLAKIKRRWKNVISMGKECGEEKLENFGSKSPNPSKDRFYIEKIVRPIVKLDDPDTIDSPKRRVPNIYIEARKHLLERLSNGIEDPDSSGRRSPQTLAKILSLSEFNSLVLSPRRDFQTGKLPFSGHEEENELLSSSKLEKFSNSSTADEMNPEGVSENVQTIVIIEDDFVTTGEERDQNGHIEQQKEMHHHDAPLESPSSSPINKKEDLDRVANEAARPSPVSVLDPLCMEEGNISPARSIESVEVHIQPLQLKFKELSKSCMDEETLAVYIKAVIRACGLNLDELYINSQTSDQLLDPSLFYKVSFGCNHHTEDIHLLFDCINEVLLEVSSCFLGSKKSIRSVQDMESAAAEVVKGVKHWYLTDQPRKTGQTLDQIIENDMARRGTWMDVQPHVEEIGVDLADEILDDIMEDIAATFMDGV